MQNNQTGIPSEFLYKPSFSNQFELSFSTTKFQELKFLYRFTKHTLESENVSLPLDSTSFSFNKFSSSYTFWFHRGFGIELNLGRESLPTYFTTSSNVSFEKLTPLTGGVGFLWRAKNQISTIEIGYRYKTLYFGDTSIESGYGYSNRLHFTINFGRNQEIMRAAEVFFMNQNDEGAFGLRFVFEATNFFTTYNNTLDERRFEFYYRLRFGSHKPRKY